MARWMLLTAVVFSALTAAFVWAAGSLDIESPTASARSAAEMQPRQPSAGFGGPQAPRIPSGRGGGNFPAPNFKLANLDGGTMGPADFAGKVVVVELWASWCGPCRLQAQILEQVKDEVGDDVQFLAVNIGESESKVRSYVNKTPFSYPVLLDPQENLMRTYGLSGLPTIIVLDRQGEITYMRSGVLDASSLKGLISQARGTSA